MTRPLDKWSWGVEFELLQLGMDFGHARSNSIRQVGTTFPWQGKELLDKVEGNQSSIRHLGLTEYGNELTYPILAGLSPDSLWGTEITLAVQGTLHQGASAVSDSATQPTVDFTKHHFVVIALGNGSNRREVVHPLQSGGGVVLSRIVADGEGAVGPEEAPELSDPLWVDPLAFNVEEIHAPIIALSS